MPGRRRMRRMASRSVYRIGTWHIAVVQVRPFYALAATDSNVVSTSGLKISEIATDTIQDTSLMVSPSPVGVRVTPNLSTKGAISSYTA